MLTRKGLLERTLGPGIMQYPGPLITPKTP